MLQDLQEVAEAEQFDVAIVGAGMVGASAAIALRQLGLKVILLDAFAFSGAVPAYTPSYDERSTALSWGTRDILEALKVWSEVARHACAISSIHISEKDRFGSARMYAQDYHQAALGYVVPNQWLGRCLLSRVEELNIPLLAGVKVVSIQPGKRQRLALDNYPAQDAGGAKTVSVKLLIIADGSESETARQLGIDYSVEPYQQHAIIANVTTELPNEGRAFERFTRNGPLAMLPLSDYQCALVWTHDQADAHRYLDMPDKAFAQALEAHFGERLGAITRCGERVSYPLNLIQAKEHCRAGVLLLGNAAHSLHPVAGQGFNLAIRGVAAFAEQVGQALVSDNAFESLKFLNAFCAQRMSDQAKTVLMSDQLVKLFGSRSPFLSLAREWGLIGFDNSPLLKSLFAASAMGLAERKPLITNT